MAMAKEKAAKSSDPQLGSAQRRHNGFRAGILGKAGTRRDTEAEALSDLAEMRGATSRADVGLVAARLRANAATHRAHRATTQDAEDAESRDASAATGHAGISATGHADALATGHASVSTAGGD